MKDGHRTKNCIFRSCVKCNKKHNTLLHLDTSAQSANKSPSESTSAVIEIMLPTIESTSLNTSKRSTAINYVFLSTAMVIIRANGAEVKCRAVLDSGSQLNFVTERLVKRLGITKNQRQ